MATYIDSNLSPSTSQVALGTQSDTYVGYSQNDFIYDQSGAADRITVSGVVNGFTTLSGVGVYGFGLLSNYESIDANGIRTFAGLEIWDMAPGVNGLNLGGVTPSGAYYTNGVTVNGNDEWNLIITTSYNDTIYGGDHADTVSFQNYSRYVSSVAPFASVDSYYGTNGVAPPVSSFDYQVNGVKVDLLAGKATAVANNSPSGQVFNLVNDSLVNVERAVGSMFNDVLIGNGSANLFEGYDGHDILVGGKGWH